MIPVVRLWFSHIVVKIRGQWERELLAVEVDVEQSYSKTI
jgi:hypothetical protein